ncbi:hypothetical protein BD414DRAFT_478278 [Trametes punicea]|nr:hypothetical protein BD414DRAFT_478278 [Trametes punicea]
MSEDKPMDRNMLASTRKALEDDIAIFYHVAQESYTMLGKSYRPYYDSSRFYAWVGVTHVCRSWRAIALNTPRIWGHIVLTRSSVVDDVLARSKKAPLMVTGCLMSSHDDRAKLVKTVMQESARLKELRLSGPSDVFRDLFPKTMEPAKLLVTMALSDHTPGVSFLSSKDVFQPIFLQQQLPHLRDLEIRRVIFRWDSYVFSSTITRLVLSGRLDSQSLLGTFEHLLFALETMPRLEIMELEDAIPRLQDTTMTLPIPGRTVALPHMRRLALTGTSLDCAHLINHLSLRADTHSKFVCRGTVGAQELVRVIGEHVARHDPFLAVHLSRTYSGKLSMKGWRTLVDSSLAEPCIELQIDALACSTVASYLVRHSKMFTHTRVLEVNAEDHDWRWKDVFAGMPDLRVLSITGDPQDHFFTALSAPRKSKRNRPPSLILPNLRVLKLSGTRMSSSDYDNPQGFLDKLEDWLILRCNYGLPIDELHLTSCLNSTEEDVERLVPIVPYVIWDGVEVFESEEEDEEEEDYDPYPDDDYEYYDYDDAYGDVYDDPGSFL